jgi:hypothetical protein
MTRKKSLFRYPLWGFCLGTLVSTAYVLVGPWDWGWPGPLWARIMLFPGVAAGHLVYNAGWHSILACQIVGVGTMGIVAAMIGCGVAIVMNRRIRREADDEVDATGT